MTDWPFELVDYLVAGSTLLIGITVGKRMRPRPPAPLKPTCSCRHGFGTHQDSKACNGKAGEVSEYNQFGSAIAWTKVPCTCLRYDGPDPAIFGLEIS